MSEKDKMLAGILYDANNDKELIKDRCKAKDICFEYNRILIYNLNLNLISSFFNDFPISSVK